MRDFLLFFLQLAFTHGSTAGRNLASPFDTKWTGEACEGRVLELYCEEDMVIDITATSWGYQSGMDNCLAVNSSSCPQIEVQAISDMCNNQASCSINVTSDELGEPCEGSDKALYLEYTCKMSTYLLSQCENRNTTLECPANKVIQVYGGFYGRPANDVCNPVDEQFNTTCPGEEGVASKIGLVCNGQNKCLFTPVNSYLGDPCPGEYKSMSVNYVCGECNTMHSSEEECDEWAASGECDANSQWMNAYCRKSCWGCEEQEDTDGCLDDDEECPKWADDGECLINPDYMTTFCKKSCNTCDEQQDGCSDDDEECPKWASEGECLINKEYMTYYCSKSCNTCEEFVDEGPDFIAEEDTPYSSLVCETQFVNTNCGDESGLYLRIDDIFFGREDNDTCPHESITSLNCSITDQTEGLEMARKTCNGRPTCKLGASSRQWGGDPCPGTFKYFEVDHHCQRCMNVAGDSECEKMKEDGMCETDPDSMLDSCFKTCTGCEDTTGCSNSHPNAYDCDVWATAGECDSNPVWMEKNCQLSCRVCREESEIEEPISQMPANTDDDPTYQSSLSSPYDTEWGARACEGQVLELYCRDGMVIEITNTSWGGHGQDCNDNDNSMCGTYTSVSAIHDLCDGESSCFINVTSVELGDPCAGFNKTLRLEHTCKMKTYTSYQCENSRTSMQCPDNQVIKVYDGFFGRLDEDFCNPWNETFEATCTGQDDIGSKVGAVCDGKNECVFTPNNYYLNDTCPGTYKYMGVNYVCAECTNEYEDDTACDIWAAGGECDINPDWMGANCRKSCWGCDEEQSDGCLDDDEECVKWASEGECVINPDYMNYYCRKSCNTCPEWIPNDYTTYFGDVCHGRIGYASCGDRLGLYIRINTVFYGRESNDICPDESATSLNCSVNVDEVLEKSRQACDGRELCYLGATTRQWGDPCPGSSKYISLDHTCQRCVNVDDDSECEKMKEDGMCETDQDSMLDSCFKTCTGCEAERGCRNIYGDDMDCDIWAVGEECENNPVWMRRNCQLSCRACADNA